MADSLMLAQVADACRAADARFDKRRDDVTESLFARLREAGVTCGTCKSFDAYYWGEPGDKYGMCKAEGSDEVFDNWGRSDEPSHVKPAFLCNEWEAK